MKAFIAAPTAKRILSILCLLFAVAVPFIAFSAEGNTDGSGGGIIAFYSGRGGNNSIYLMNADGTAQTRLTDASAEDTCPAISPDGGNIVFLSDRDGAQNIYIMDTDGGNVRRLTETSETKEQPSWAGGSQILFVKDYASYTEIWIMNIDGTEQTRLTASGYRDERPVLSPQWGYRPVHVQP